MSQSEVSEVIRGRRRVVEYRVLVRIAEGLGIPREAMKLGAGGTYAEGTEGAEGVDADVYRRELIGSAAAAWAGLPLRPLSELIGLPVPSPDPVPSRVCEVDVVQVRDLTRKLREASRTYGSTPQVSSATAAWATRLLTVPGAEPVKRALLVAVAELHLHAGWAAFDAGLPGRTLYHYNRGHALATVAGDAYLQALALNFAGLATVEDGHPDQGLKLLQFAHLRAADIPSDDQSARVVWQASRASVQACGQADSATALARLGQWAAADREVAEARQLWQPTPADQNGDLDQVVARLELERGRLEVAEPFAAASAQRWGVGSSQSARTMSGILLATIHVQAGEPDGLRLAHDAITGVARLSSVRARQRLEPLVTALEARPGSDYHQLARMARHLTTTRA